LEVIEGYRGDARIAIIAKGNEGTVATKNLGLRMVETHWVIFLDADDVLPQNYVRATVDVACAENADVVYTDFRYFGAKDERVAAGEMSRIRILRENFIHNSALIKTTVARLVGGYKVELKHGLEDWELYLSLAKTRARFRYAKGVEFLYRQHEGGSSRNQMAGEHHREIRSAIGRYHRGVKLFRYWWHVRRVQGLFAAAFRKLFGKR
jgi:glycosyltransferase involved in cell wall biosynthesis